jgi:hypothetical protein
VCTNLEGLLQNWDLCAIDKKSFLGGPNLLQEKDVIMFKQIIK